MKALQALLAFVMLVLLLGGVPSLLLAWGDPLALLEAPWATALMRPDDGTILLGLLSIVGWLAWVVIAVTTITELISHLSRQRIRIHLPGITWLQPAVGVLVAMALSPVLSSHADEPAPPPASHAPQQVGQSNASVVPPLARQGPSSRDYVVVIGDELWGVAERQLGNGGDWRSIIACNPGMTADTVLTPGDTIHLPASAQTPQKKKSVDLSHVTVKRDDTLWDLAEEHLGDPHRWPEIFEANRDVVTNPDEIDIGWQLSLPVPPQSPTPTGEPLNSGDGHPGVESLGENHESPVSSDADDGANTSPEAPTTESSAPSPSSEASFSSAPASSIAASRMATPGVNPTTVVSDDGATASSVAPTSTVTSSKTVDSMPHLPGAKELHQGSSGTQLDALGPIGAVLAASLVAGVMARRQVQLLHRAIGSRITSLTPSLQRFFTGLVRRSQSAQSDLPQLPSTTVVVGWGEHGDVHVDLEQQRCTLLTGSDDHTASMAAAILTSLLCADWSSDVEVVAVQPGEDWSSALDDPRLSSQDHLDEALTHLQRLCAQRRLQLGHDSLGDVRADPDRAEMWAPVVFIFCRALQSAHVDRIHDCLSLGPVGVSVVATAQSPVAIDPPASVLDIESETRALLGSDTAFQPQLLNQPARHAVMSLFASALDERTEPAPWWRDGEEAVVTASSNLAAGPFKDGAMSAWPTQPDHPTLLLLGPVELLGSRGERPARATGQCIEYCAWLLVNPGSSPTAMVRELLVAETTRRSNMSRLRSWLGSDAANSPYLPDAYSGRITLAPAVTSDWERFQLLLAGGVNTSSTPLLREALSLVRGKPLDGVAFQWPWTSQLLTDMTSMIGDAATVLTDRYLTEQDYPGALWAINQGQLATGDDETLAVRRIQVLAQTGENAEVDAAVMQLTRAARATNRDLSADSIRRIQHALHLSMSRASGS